MYSLKMQQALIDTVQKYEQAMVDLRYGDNLAAVKQRWEDYGIIHLCPLCQAATGCSSCVLGPEDYGCCCWTSRTLTDKRDSGTRREFLDALHKRLSRILEIAKGNGITLEE